MCECAIGVDVRDGTTIFLKSIVAHVVMGCIVLGRQMNVDFSIVVCINTIIFVGMETKSVGSSAALAGLINHTADQR